MGYRMILRVKIKYGVKFSRAVLLVSEEIEFGSLSSIFKTSRVQTDMNKQYAGDCYTCENKSKL